ncbi:putative WD40-like Beta Propeller [Tolypothrix tenuis PCC 7101]|uniref:Putative WD40-like Beta Propeller n=1 Tax=Tolypothrix tenuis PCC 7101 TaxID=231146 RepID=A0A1Z4MTV3_9CYAN|nr:PD40 domain-containing protein [Aulosira sp. FACHB-113]BAY96899.1 putative WD40-like Beta Propeller [Tolypothrix tenuis PCC 7101]BAZ72593.1 putative WD40-like Beta Propeller [Aulosira laxa NIES-50]
MLNFYSRPLLCTLLLGTLISLTSCNSKNFTAAKAEISTQKSANVQCQVIDLTPKIQLAEEPQWSPDGKQIAFMSLDNPGNEEIYVMNADGSKLKNLTKNKIKDSSPLWSLDGKNIAFLSGRDRKQETHSELMTEKYYRFSLSNFDILMLSTSSNHQANYSD